MSKNEVIPELQVEQRLNSASPRSVSQGQSERMIAIRLQAATNLKIDQDASTAWMERKIIRDRMRYYTTPHTRVLN